MLTMLEYVQMPKEKKKELKGDQYVEADEDDEEDVERVTVSNSGCGPASLWRSS